MNDANDPYSTPAGQKFLVQAAPATFVLLWSTGYITTKMILPYGEPLTLLFWRCLLTAVIMGLLCILAKAPWPRQRRAYLLAATIGILVHGFFLGGSYFAIERGVNTGIVALIGGLQPLLTAAAAGPLLGERVSNRQWLGLVLGLGGVGLVVFGKIGFDTAGLAGTGFAVLSLLGITLGTLAQKRFAARIDLRVNMTIQFSAAAVAAFILAALSESMQVDWGLEVSLILAWMILVVSIAAFGLMFMLVKLNETSKVTSLFYLTPPLVSLWGFLLFNETLGLLAIAGMVVAALGVALVTRP